MPDVNEQMPLPSFLRHQSEMGERIRRFNWESTYLGALSAWPAELRYSVNMMLHNSHPMLICWGKDFLQLYNDAFIPVLGPQKHPASLGLPASETYAESWAIIEPMFSRVAGGETVNYQNLNVPLVRNGLLQ